MGRPLLSFAFLMIAGSLAGCVVYDPALVQREGGVDTGQVCALRHPPTRPSDEDTSQPGDLVFGLRDVVLYQTTEVAQMTGYDLDNRCTTSANRATECTPGNRAPVPTDGLDGIDNQFGIALYPLVEAVQTGLETRARAAQLLGNGLPILRIRGWNGTQNDRVIDVVISAAVFSAPGTGTTDPPTVLITDPATHTLPNGDPIPPPVWDGQDWAWVRDDSFLGGNLEMPLVRDQQAYVTDGIVVAHLPARVTITFPTDTVGVLVRLTDAVATGHLSADGTMLTDVVVAGRWSITDLLSTAENIGLCRGTGEYNALSSTLTRSADVRSDPPMAGDPMLECDALSIGVGFTGFRMRIAGVATGLPIVNLCELEAGVPDAGGMTVDAGTDASTSSSDAGMDAGTDAGRDGGTDANLPDTDVDAN